MLPRKIIATLIIVYRYIISPLYPPCCRYIPTCSDYAQQAVHQHGVFKGMLMALQRILSCHPWTEGGYDPVPEQKAVTNNKGLK